MFGVFISMQLNNIDVNETVESDDRAFEIWHEREDSVRKYTLQARTVTIKNSWLRDLRELQQRYTMGIWSKFNTHTVFSRICFHNLTIFFFSGPPDFEEILANCTAELGQTVKLACKVIGVPKPVVTWYKGKMYSFFCFGLVIYPPCFTIHVSHYITLKSR